MELYCIISITDRSKAQIMQDLYASCGLHMIFTHLGVGTARSEHLSLYGLEATDKAVVTGVASASEERQLLKAAKRRLFIDIPGNGVMLSIPLKSVAGGRTLAYLSDKKDTGGIPDMTFAHELIVAILNEGQSDFVMDAARSAGAGGGTVLHAKGTGSGRGLHCRAKRGEGRHHEGHQGKRRPRHPRGRHLLLAPDLLGRGPAQRRINKKDGGEHEVTPKS